MKKVRKQNTIIVLLGLAVLILGVLLILVITGKITFGATLEEDNCNIIDYDELAKIAKGDYNFVNGDNDNNNSAKVLSNGKVLINYLDYLENINNAKDLIIFSGAGVDSLIYILTNDGNIYKYNLSLLGEGNLKAIKINEYSNIKQILRYEIRKGNSGGCDYVILVDNNNKYYKLDAYCV